MASESLVFLVGAVVLLAGTALFAVWGITRATDGTRPYYGITTAATVVSAIAHGAAALGLDATTVTVAGRELTVHLAVFAGWLVTAPLLLAVLVLLADAGGRLLAALVVPAVLHVAGLAGAAVTTQGLAELPVERTRLALFGVAVVLLVVLLGVVFRALSPQAGRRHRRNPDVAVLFSILRNLLVAVLVLVAAVWLVAPTGLAVVGPFGAAAGYVLLTVVATVGFGALLLRDPAALATAEA